MRTARMNSGGPRQNNPRHFPMAPSLPGSQIRIVALLIALMVLSFLAAPQSRADSQGSAAQAAAAPDASWQLVHEGPTGTYFYSIYFPTGDVGYVSGGPDWNNASNGRGGPTTISKTTDGGKTWATNAIPKTDGWSRGLTCTDANSCWVAGNDATYRIRYTTDGGATWNPFVNQSGYTNWLWSAGWTKNGSTILSGTTCYDPADSGAKANWLRSTDGVKFTGVQAIPGTYMCYVQWDIECPSAGTCYSAGKNNVWRSQNDGQTWAQTSPGAYRWYGLSCTSNTNCWVSGKSPFIKYTSNSGANWYTSTVNGLGANGHFWDVVMLDNTHGLAAGCSDMATDNTDRCLGKGIVYQTTDGTTWNAVSGVPDAKDFMDIWAFSMDDYYVVDFAGKIWHYGTAGGPTVTPRPTSATTATPVTPAPTATRTNTPTATRTNTATPIRTATATATRTATPVVTPTATRTASPTSEPTATPTATTRPTELPAPTATSTFTATPTPTGTATATATAAPTDTPSATPSSTPTLSSTETPTSTATPKQVFRVYLPIFGR